MFTLFGKNFFNKDGGFKMKKIDIIGDNYFGKWDKERTACRGIVINKNDILLSYETLTDNWMIPGGGIENDEADVETACGNGYG